jgi:hypothetical protein
MAKGKSEAMHVARIISRHGDREYVSVLLRRSFREGGKVKNQTLANLSHLPAGAVDLVGRYLAGERFASAGEGLRVERSWPHGHVAAVLGMARQLGLEQLIDPVPSRKRDLVLGMVVGRIVEPASKLATARLWDTTSLGRSIGVERVTDDELYQALDWLVERQEDLEQRLAARYLRPGGLALYDLTSVYLEGTHCPLAHRGYSRDGLPGTLQIEFGLLTNAEGDPVSAEVFAGNTGDPATFARQVEKVRQRFGVDTVIWTGDRGMITQARIERLREAGGHQWITALRAPAIRKLAATQQVQMSLFDQQGLAEIRSEDYPGERLVVCFNPLMAEERQRKREGLLAATERELQKVAEMVARGAEGGRWGLVGEAAIGERVGRVVNKYKVAKHFQRTITAQGFTYQRDAASIGAEAQLDGVYILRTNVEQEQMDAPAVVRAYKSLSNVERGFRHLKLSGLEVRPVYHYLAGRVRAHILLCMLAYIVQRGLEKAWAPLLFIDEAPPARLDPVSPPARSPAARRKEQTLRTGDGLPVHSFRTLLRDLGTMVRNRLVAGEGGAAFELITLPTPLQAKAFHLLGIPLSAL